MNKLIKLTVLALSGMSLALTACSNEKDDPTPDTPSDPKVGEVFPNGLPVSVDDYTIVTNEDGLVTEMKNGYRDITIEYGEFSRGDNFNVKATLNWIDEFFVYYIQTNKHGFATYVLEEDVDGDGTILYTDTWKFEYNSDGQLSRYLTDGDRECYTLSYTNGDITKVVGVNKDDTTYEYTIAYTDGKPNKGCVMDFDLFFGLELNLMGEFYYAGLLGKATKNLPTGFHEKRSNGFNQTCAFLWEFNTNDLPVKFGVGQLYHDYLTWSWR